MVNRLEFDNRNLNEKVYKYLRDKIINNELKPGTRINYGQLNQELGVSKTPLRDALYRLQQDELIEIIPRSGTYVSTPKVTDIEEIFDVRKALERQAVALAMNHISQETITFLLNQAQQADEAIHKANYQVFFEADRELHRILIKHSHNKRLTKMMQSLEAQIAWIGVIIAKSAVRPLHANNMHKQILNAMLDDNVHKAQSLMEQHLEEIKQMTLSDFA